MAKKVKDPNKKSLFVQFKEFISRGSVLDMAIGVIVGGAFSAIVTAVVNILMSVCTWAVPGGIAGLVTVLPAFPGSAQGGVAGIGQTFSATSEGIQQAVEAYATSMGVTYEDSMFAQYWTLLQGLYTKHGGTYVANAAACIDWGTLINAVISFLIIALTLFIILKVATKAKEAREQMKAKALEEHYKKHPEDRPVPPEPGVPEPTDHEILKEMLAVIKAQKADK